MSKVRDLKYFFRNPFSLGRISLPRMVSFSADLIHRMAANNPDGKLTERITAVSTALFNLSDESINNQLQLGIRKGAVFTKTRFREDLTGRLRLIYGAVLSGFNDPSPEMKEIFPVGRTAIVKAADDDLIVHLNIMIKGLRKFEDELGTPPLDLATALREEWLEIHALCGAASGKKSVTEATRRGARERLEVELFRTLAYLAYLFPTEPDRFELYMQQHLLKGRDRLATETAEAETENRSEQMAS